MKTIRIPQGNEFSLFVPLVLKDGTAVEGERLSNIQVLLQSAPPRQSYAVSVNVQSNYVVITPQVELPLGSYDLMITAKYENRDIAILLNNCFSISTWTNGSDYEKYLVGREIVLEQQVLIGAFNTDAELETLKEQYRTAIAAAQAAQAEAETAKEAFDEKAEQLEDVAQETTSQEIKQDVADVKTAVENIDFSELAKQGTNANATNSAILEAVSVSPIGLESELQTGKQAIAEAIVQKGVEAESTDTLAELADKIGGITTQEITIDGGEMYEKYMVGTFRHNLFDVARNIRNTGNYDQYSGFVVAEYYKGYATFDLTSIQADAYLTSDGDYYTIGQLHTWHDDDDNMSDRYIVFFYVNDNYTFRSAISGVCPRIMVIVGNCAGVYIDFNRLTNLYVFKELGASLSAWGNGTNTPGGDWAPIQVISGIEELSFLQGQQGFFINNNNILYAEFPDLKISNISLLYTTSNNSLQNLYNINVPNLEKINGSTLIMCRGCGNCLTSLEEIRFPELTTINTCIFFTDNNSTLSKLKRVILPKLKRIEEDSSSSDFYEPGVFYLRSGGSDYLPSITEISLPELEEIGGKNNGTCVFYLSGSGARFAQNLKKLELPKLKHIYVKSHIWGWNLQIDTELYLPSVQTIEGGNSNDYAQAGAGKIYLDTIESGILRLGGSGGCGTANTRYVFMGAKGTSNQTIGLWSYYNNAVTDFEIGDKENIDAGLEPRWYPLQPINLSKSPNLTKENIVNHILNRLGTNNGSPITITLGATNLAKLTAEEIAIATNKGFTLA